MAVIDLFSKRQKRLRDEYPDVYVYDQIPQELRAQVVHIINETIALIDRNSPTFYRENYFISMHNILCKEYGKFYLCNSGHAKEHDIKSYLVDTENHEHVLDILELFLKVWLN